jgi:hypothetical protein
MNTELIVWQCCLAGTAVYGRGLGHSEGPVVAV